VKPIHRRALQVQLVRTAVDSDFDGVFDRIDRRLFRKSVILIVAFVGNEDSAHLNPSVLLTRGPYYSVEMMT
jgi:hypothetical protein